LRAGYESCSICPTAPAGCCRMCDGSSVGARCKKVRFLYAHPPTRGVSRLGVPVQDGCNSGRSFQPPRRAGSTRCTAHRELGSKREKNRLRLSGTNSGLRRWLFRTCVLVYSVKPQVSQADCSNHRCGKLSMFQTKTKPGSLRRLSQLPVPLFPSLNPKNGLRAISSGR
jgi:hypothetical protein